jgi:hypothetical protein
MKKLTDPTFKYTPAAATNIRLTFARERKRLREEKAALDAKITKIIRRVA